MRIGIELNGHVDLERVGRADTLGFWAVSVGGPSGTEVLRAAEVAEATENLRVLVRLDLEADHPLTLAEEVSVLDNLSGGRSGVIVAGAAAPQTLRHFREALIGRVYQGVVLAPPTVQMEVPVWCSAPVEGAPAIATAPEEVLIRPGQASLGRSALSGDIEADGKTVDRWREAGCTHLLVVWPGSLEVLARHLVTRAATADFPRVVAELADTYHPQS